jgi:hypothetical protein
MQSVTTRTAEKRRKFISVVTAFAVATLTGGLLSVPAHAQDHHENRGRQMERHHDDHGRDRHDGDYRLHSYGAPAYVYAPPPVYYAPPPGPPVIDFVFPLHLR